jgi:hypothetical protein
MPNPVLLALNMKPTRLPCRPAASAKTGHRLCSLRPIRRSVFGVRRSVFSSFAFCRHWVLGVDRVRRSLLRGLLFAVLLLPLRFVSAQVAETPVQVDEAPYFGDWENDRGDTLQITGASIQINNEKPVRYDDITEDSDESFFVLQIKDSSELSYFGGNFLRITFGKDPDHFSMSIYKTLPDTLKKENEVKRIEWSAPAVETEETEQKEQPKEEQPKEEQKKNEEKKSDQPKDDQGKEKATASPSATPSPSAP